MIWIGHDVEVLCLMVAMFFSTMRTRSLLVWCEEFIVISPNTKVSCTIAWMTLKRCILNIQ